MPEGVIAEVADGYATLDFVNPALKNAALGRLINIGGPESVKKITRDGPRFKYRVPEDVAAEAGLLDVAGAVRGDTGYSQALAEVGHAGARPEQPTSANTFSGATPKEEVLQGGHVATTHPPTFGTASTAHVEAPPKRGPGRPKKIVAPDEPEPTTG